MVTELIDVRASGVFMLAALVALATDATAETRPPYGGDIVASLLSEPTSLDPLEAQSHAEVTVVDLVCDTLYDVDDAGHPQPRLAAGLPILTPDGREARIELRTGIRFHDGGRLHAADVAKSLERVRTSKRAGYSLAPVTAVRAEGNAVVLELARATPELAALLAAPTTAVTRGGRGARRDRVIGTGPFRIRLVDRKRSRIVLEAFDDHAGGRPYVDVVELRWYDTADGEARAYEAGETHASFRGAVAFAGHTPRHATSEVVGPATVLSYVGFGKSHDGVTGNRHFRRALSLALDRDSFRSVGTGEPVAAAVVPAAAALGGPTPARSVRVARSREARAALAKAGLTALPTLSIAVDRTRPDDAEAAKKVAAALLRLGISSRIEVLAAPELAARVAAGRGDLFIGQLAAPTALPSLQIAAAFAAGADAWPTAALAARVLTVAAATSAFDSRLPIVPLYHRAIRAHHRKTLGGVRFDALGRLSFADVFVFTR